MSKKAFWKWIPEVKCPKCEKEYKKRSAMIAHMVREHGYDYFKARDTVDALGIYVPLIYRVRRF